MVSLWKNKYKFRERVREKLTIAPFFVLTINLCQGSVVKESTFRNVTTSGYVLEVGTHLYEFS